MALTLYTVSGAPRGWRVLIGLTLKGLDYDVHYLEASRQEHKSPEYLRINPRGQVPALDADGLVIRESIGILAWLDREYRDQPLFGTSPAEAAQIWQLTLECEDHLRSAINNLLHPVLVENIEMPKTGSEERAALEAAGEAMHVELRFLDDELNGQSYLCGDRPSAAEAVAFPEIRLLQRAMDREPEIMAALGFRNMADRYPRLFEWLNRVTALEGMDKTLPIHW